MAVEQYAPPIFIIDGIPISFAVGAGDIKSVSQNTTGSIQVHNGSSESLFLLGTSMKKVFHSTMNKKYADGDTLVKEEVIATTFTIDFWIGTTGVGLAFKDVLIPLLTAARKALDIPCQFIWSGYYMGLGFLQNFTSSQQGGETRVLYHCEFVENMYRSYTNKKNEALSIGKSEQHQQIRA